jgi:nucleotide-binding universal stress UspA family protein
MKSIVVPINFSSCSVNAARYAADLALAVQSDLHLIHIIQVPVSSAELMMTEYLYGQMIVSADTALKQLQVELIKRTKHRIKIDTTVESGNVGSKINYLCQPLKPYAIVLGATGPTLEKFLAGSPVTSMLHNLDYPVLIVPETFTFQRFRRVLLACDLDDIGCGMHNSLPLLKDLREHFGCRFDIVTVETRKALTDESTVFEPSNWKDQLKDLYPVIHYIRKPKVEEGILEYLSKHDADLIMVFPKKHRLFDFHVSQSRKIAEHCPIPVLSLQE